MKLNFWGFYSIKTPKVMIWVFSYSPLEILLQEKQKKKIHVLI